MVSHAIDSCPDDPARWQFYIYHTKWYPDLASRSHSRRTSHRLVGGKVAPPRSGPRVYSVQTGHSSGKSVSETGSPPAGCMLLADLN
jgi:hypothetical protein